MFIQIFSKACQMVFSKGYRRFVVIPLLLNLIVFGVLSYFFIHAMQNLMAQVASSLPLWLHWLTWLLWPLAIVSGLIFYAYSFNLITTIVAAPFLGLLAEKIVIEITGKMPPEETWGQLTLRTIKREFIKLGYFIPRTLAVLLTVWALLFLPGPNLFGILLGTVWGSWCLALQFCDYAADNQHISFAQLRNKIGEKKSEGLLFGCIIFIASMTPFINIFITPIATAAGTLYWLRRLEQ